MKAKIKLIITCRILFTAVARLTYLTVFLCFLPFIPRSQTLVFKGIVKDEQTLKPIPDVNIKVIGTTLGAATDKTGRFVLKLDKIPTSLGFSCVGFNEEHFKVTKITDIQLEFLLRSKAYNLKEVNITSNNYSFLFKDREYSVLDYELMDDNVLLLIFRTLLKQSQLVLLNRNGDTLAVSALPELPPTRLYKDFLSNIHYCSKPGNAYQCFYNREAMSLDFLYKTKLDSLRILFKPFIFSMSDHIYFQASILNGFGTTFGIIEPGKGKKYIRQVINKKKITEYTDDQIFYQKWNAGCPPQHYFMQTNPDEFDIEPAFNFSVGDSGGGAYEKNEARAHSFEYFNMIFPVIKTRDNTIAFFNFGNDVIELMDKDGKLLQKIPITFHKGFLSKYDSVTSVRLSESGWRWSPMILVDEFNRNMYTIFLKNEIVRIHRINMETGQLLAGTILPLPFPEKIELYDGEAYFLNKGVNENWKLVKCKL